MKWSNRVDQKFSMLIFGHPVDRTSPEKEKLGRCQKWKVAFLATTWPKHPLSDHRTSQHLRGVHSTQLWAILVRETRERRRNQEEHKLGTKCWPGDFHLWTTLFNVFQDWFLRVLSVIHYFQMWGTQICWENILFLT